MVILALNALISFIAWAGVSEHLQYLIAFSKRHDFDFLLNIPPAQVLYFANTPTWSIILGLFLMLIEIFLSSEHRRNQLAILCVIQWIPLAYILAAFLSGIVPSGPIYWDTQLIGMLEKEKIEPIVAAVI